jgi:hypothetical protein
MPTTIALLDSVAKIAEYQNLLEILPQEYVIFKTTSLEALKNLFKGNEKQYFINMLLVGNLSEDQYLEIFKMKHLFGKIVYYGISYDTTKFFQGKGFYQLVPNNHRSIIELMKK